MIKGLPDNMDEEAFHLTSFKIAKPVYKLFMKKISEELLSGYYKDMSFDCFATIVINCLADVDRNVFEFLMDFYNKNTKNYLPLEKLIDHLHDILKDNMNVTIDKH